MIDIILTTYNRCEYLKRTLECIFEKTDGIPYRLFIADDCSDDGTQEYLSKLRHDNLAHVILSKGRNGVRYGINALWAAVREYDTFHAKYPYMCYFQDDIEIMEQGWLKTLIEAYEGLKGKHNIGFFSGFDCIEHPNIETINWRERTVFLKKSTGFPNVVAEKPFWESIGRVPRVNPNGKEAGFPGDGKGSNMDVWFTGCYSKSRFDAGAASPNCSFNQKRSVMVIPMMRHLGQVSGSTWAEDRYRKKIDFNPELTKQHESELMALCGHIGSLRNVIEIGTFKGGTACVWASISSGKVITIDQKPQKDLCFEGKAYEGRIHKVEGRSQSTDTESKVKEILSGDKVDLLFLDGGHSKPDVKEDFRRYSKYVAAGGWIAFHDIKNTDNGIGVPEFWGEIKGKFENREFFILDQPLERRKTIWGMEERNEKGDCNRNGIGLIRWVSPGRGRAVAFFTNGIGNLVMMMPALQAMASLAENKKIDVCIDHHWRDSRRQGVIDILKTWPVIGKLLDFPNDRISVHDYEHWFFSPHGSSNDASSLFLYNMRQIISKPAWRRAMTHEADHYMEIARGAGYDGPIPKVSFPVADGPILDLPRPIIGLCNGFFRTSTHYWDNKGWPHFARFSEVGGLYFGGSVVGVGMKGELPRDCALSADYCGELSILETAKVISQLDLLVTTDTGLMHIADIMGTPLIAMFGPTLTSKNAPRNKTSQILQAGMKCAPCQDTAGFNMCRSNECMRSITVGDAMAKAREIVES